MAAHGLWQNPNWRRMTVACLVLVTGGVIFIGSRIVVQAGQVQRQREEALQREAAEMARQLAIERARLEELPPMFINENLPCFE